MTRKKKREVDLSADIERLVESGKKTGVITYSDISKVFTDDVIWTPYLDELFARLEEEGIEVVEDKEISPAAEQVVDDSLKSYLKEVEKIPTLSPKEEKKLAKQIDDSKLALKNIENKLGISVKRFKRLFKINPQSINLPQREIEEIYQKITQLEELIEESKNKFIEANLKLVVSIARKYTNPKVPLIDLINEGNLGLMRAVDKYDYKEGYRFSTYGIYWIRQAILQAISTLPRLIKVPLHVSEIINKYLKTAQLLAQQLGREPTLEEIAEKINIPITKLLQLINVIKEPLSLEAPISPFEEETTLGEKLEDKRILSPHQIAFLNMLKGHLDQLFEYLSEKEKLVIKLRYGIEEDSHTLEETGRILKLTRERVRQLELKALQKLKKIKISKELYEALYIEG